MISFNVPLEVQLSSNKKWILNLNNYRNTHYRTLNKAKQEYGKLISPHIPKFKADVVKLEYKLFPKTKRRTDISNPLSIVDKFVCDVLVAEGCICDDDYTHVTEVLYRFGEVDPENPRCEITIKYGNT